MAKHDIDKVLDDLGASKIDNLIILNKVDLLKDLKLIKEKSSRFPNSITISALDHLQLYELKNAILNRIKKNYRTKNQFFLMIKEGLLTTLRGRYN